MRGNLVNRLRPDGGDDGLLRDLGGKLQSTPDPLATVAKITSLTWTSGPKGVGSLFRPTSSPMEKRLAEKDSRPPRDETRKLFRPPYATVRVLRLTKESVMSETQAAVNWEQALEGVEGDEQLLQELAEAFLQEAPSTLVEIRQGIEEQWKCGE